MEERSLPETPSSSVASAITAMVVIGLILQRSILGLSGWSEPKGRLFWLLSRRVKEADGIWAPVIVIGSFFYPCANEDFEDHVPPRTIQGSIGWRVRASALRLDQNITRHELEKLLGNLLIGGEKE